MDAEDAQAEASDASESAVADSRMLPLLATSPPRTPPATPAAAGSNELQLSSEQLEILEAARAGENIFLGGGAGTGKSVTLRALIKLMVELHGESAVAVCASTGIAAEPLGGTTLHSLIRCGLAQYYSDFLKAWEGKPKNRIRSLKVLIVDEISMISGELLDALDDTITFIRMYETTENPSSNPGKLRKLRSRDRDRAFGGLQVIFCGDFGQLPPVEKMVQPVHDQPGMGTVWYRHPFWERIHISRTGKTTAGEPRSYEQVPTPEQVYEEIQRLLKIVDKDEDDLRMHLENVSAGASTSEATAVARSSSASSSSSSSSSASSAASAAGGGAASPSAASASSARAPSGQVDERAIVGMHPKHYFEPSRMQDNCFCFTCPAAGKTPRVLEAERQAAMPAACADSNAASGSTDGTGSSASNAAGAGPGGAAAADAPAGLQVANAQADFAAAASASSCQSIHPDPNAKQRRQDELAPRTRTGDVNHGRGMAFESWSWWRCDFRIMTLTKVWRQSDANFVRLLDHMRDGNFTSADVSYLEVLRQNKLVPVNGIAPTLLCTTNSKVATTNEKALEMLDGPEHVYVAAKLIAPEIHDPYDRRRKSRLTPEKILKIQEDQVKALSNLMNEKLPRDKSKNHNAVLASRVVVRLRIGAQVMLTTNLDLNPPDGKMLVNGSRGVVIRWMLAETRYGELALAAEQLMVKHGRYSVDAVVALLELKEFVAIHLQDAVLLAVLPDGIRSARRGQADVKAIRSRLIPLLQQQRQQQEKRSERSAVSSPAASSGLQSTPVPAAGAGALAPMTGAARSAPASVSKPSADWFSGTDSDTSGILEKGEKDTLYSFGRDAFAFFDELARLHSTRRLDSVAAPTPAPDPGAAAADPRTPIRQPRGVGPASSACNAASGTPSGSGPSSAAAAAAAGAIPSDNDRLEGVPCRTRAGEAILNPAIRSPIYSGVVIPHIGGERATVMQAYGSTSEVTVAGSPMTLNIAVAVVEYATRTGQSADDADGGAGAAGAASSSASSSASAAAGTAMPPVNGEQQQHPQRQQQQRTPEAALPPRGYKRCLFRSNGTEANVKTTYLSGIADDHEPPTFHIGVVKNAEKYRSEEWRRIVRVPDDADEIGADAAGAVAAGADAAGAAAVGSKRPRSEQGQDWSMSDGAVGVDAADDDHDGDDNTGAAHPPDDEHELSSKRVRAAADDDADVGAEGDEDDGDENDELLDDHLLPDVSNEIGGAIDEDDGECDQEQETQAIELFDDDYNDCYSDHAGAASAPSASSSASSADPAPASSGLSDAAFGHPGVHAPTVVAAPAMPPVPASPWPPAFNETLESHSAEAAASPASPGPSAAAAAASSSTPGGQSQRRCNQAPQWLPSKDMIPWKVDPTTGKQILYPLVRFLNGRDEFISPCETTEHHPGIGDCTLVQLPLKLAWAMTIHKSQGMSLDYVIVDLQNTFVAGQAYVGLSRARSPEGLEIRNFEQAAVRANPLVQRFYRMLAVDERQQIAERNAGLGLASCAGASSSSSSSSLSAGSAGAGAVVVSSSPRLPVQQQPLFSAWEVYRYYPDPYEVHAGKWALPTSP